jgi:hypothetical protein
MLGAGSAILLTLLKIIRLTSSTGESCLRNKSGLMHILYCLGTFIVPTSTCTDRAYCYKVLMFRKLSLSQTAASDLTVFNCKWRYRQSAQVLQTCSKPIFQPDLQAGMIPLTSLISAVLKPG